MNKKLKVVYLDMENSRMWIRFPAYSLYNNNAISPQYIEKDWHFTSGAWAELDLQKKKVGKIHTVSNLEKPGQFKKDHRNDKHIVTTLHKVLRDVDVVIGHNAAAFDLSKLNYKFTIYGLDALDFVVIDTLKAARTYYKASSNSLYFLAREFGVPMKKELAKGVMWAADEGSIPDLKKLIAYNKGDIISGASVYFKMMPYIKNHPDIRRLLGIVSSPKEGLITRNCEKCGSSKVHRHGYLITKIGKFIRFKCQECGSASKGPKV